MGRVRYVFGMATLATIGFFILLSVGLAIASGLRGDDAAHPLCETLAELKEGTKPIVARGEFRTHHDALAFVGDVVTFSLAVAYDADTVTVRDEGLGGFNVSPFTLRADGVSITKTTHGQCTVKEASFPLQMLDVQIGAPNTFFFVDADGIERVPDIPYALNGVGGALSPKYGPLFIGSITDGRPSRPSNVPRISVDAPPESRSPASITWWVPGVFGVVFIVFSLEAFVAVYRKKRTPIAAPRDIVLELFPRLYDQDPRRALIGAYVTLADYPNLEEVRRAAGIVFTPKENDKEALSEALSFIRQALNERKGELERDYGGGAP